MSFDGRRPVFFVAEIEVYQPGPTAKGLAVGHGTHAHGAPTLRALGLESTGTIRASDMGYVTRESDDGGLLAYPPWLDTAYEIDRKVGLAPGDASTRTYGSIRLTNLGQRYDAFAYTRNSDNRPVRVLMGQKSLCPVRLLLTDPPRAELVPVFGGVALPWQQSEETLEIPLADPAAWLNRPVQSQVYLGTGGLTGGSELAGKPLPMVRGGTSGQPVQDVPLVTVDAVNLIYQWTDGPGTVLTLYEGGGAVFTYDGDVANITAGTPPAAGHYRTCNTKGLLQLGSKPVATLSADATGRFPVSSVSSPAAMARAMMVEDMGLPISLLDVDSFALADGQRPYPAGYAVGTDPMQGSDLLALILASINARLVCTRSGLLKCFLLAGLGGAMPTATLSPANTISVSPQALPSTVSPPPYRMQVGWGRVWTVQTSGLNGSISAARQAQIGTGVRYAAAFSAAVKTKYRRPNDPPPVDTVLLRQQDAAAMAQVMLDLFANGPGSYAVEVPLPLATGLDIGSIVRLVWPLADLGNGQIGQIVGEQVRSADASVTFEVLAA